MDASFAERLEHLDVTLFDPLPSQTTLADRRALLAVWRFFHRRGAYRYLEVGSHLGGSLQVPYHDPACTAIVSIDPRPTVQADTRLGGDYVYAGNTSERMRALLHRLDKGKALPKLHCHDGDFENYLESPSPTTADLVFIDAEHTPAAMLADLRRALSLQPAPSVVLMHDVEALAAHTPELEALAEESGLHAHLLSPSLLALGAEGFFRARGEIPAQPLSALVPPATTAPPVEAVTLSPGVVIATTLAAQPDLLIDRLTARNPQWFDAGRLRPALPKPPPELLPARATGDAVPVFREVFTPFANAFSAAHHRGLKLIFFLPDPLEVLDNLGRAPVFPHSDSWAAIRSWHGARLLGLVKEAQTAAQRGPVWCLFGPVSEEKTDELIAALSATRGAVIGRPPPLPDILTPPFFSTATETRLGPLPEEDWVALHESFEFAANMIALACQADAEPK